MKKDRKLDEEVKDKCQCGDNCTCGDNCDCSDNCHCGNECHCTDECACGDDCTCGGDNKCSENCICSSTSESEYLELAKRIQAEFENFRKRSYFELEKAREDGAISVIEVFLPCLDTFKVAKKSISDPTVLEGVEMIENNIIKALEKIGVEKIESVGKVYNPHLHNVIAVTKVEDKDNDIILDEYQAGYKYKGKVIRYSKVIVNKKED